MSQKTKFDRKLEDFITRSRARIAGLVLADEMAEEYKALALRSLARSEALLKPAVARAIQENHDVYLATERARTAEAEVEATYEPLYLSLEAVRIAKALTNTEVGAGFGRELEQVGATTTPSAFRALGLDHTLTVGEAVTGFAQQHLDADNPHQSALTAALQALRQARATLDSEQGEAANAMRALEAARDQSRAFYSSARDALRGGLRIAGRSEPLRQFMPSLRDIYGSSSPSEIGRAHV